MGITKEQIEEVREGLGKLHRRSAEVEAGHITAAEAALHQIDALVRIALTDLEQGNIPSGTLIDAVMKYEHALSALMTLAEMATDRAGRPL